MYLRNKRTELYAFVSTVGVAAGLGGYIANLYSNLLATFLMIAIIMVGVTLVAVLTDPPKTG